MSNETKRDVFLNAVDALTDAQASGGNIGHQDAKLFMAEYENALPDDLPVIPKAIGEYIQWGNKYDIQLYMMYYSQLIQMPGYKKLTDDAKRWIANHQDEFARAWLDGYEIEDKS